MLSDLPVAERAAGGGQVCVLVSSIPGHGDNPAALALARQFATPEEDELAFRAAVACLCADILDSAGGQDFALQPVSEDWYASSGHGLLLRRAIELIATHWRGRHWDYIDISSIGMLLPFWVEALSRAGVSPALIAYHDLDGRYQGAVSERLGAAYDVGDAIWLAHVLEFERVSRGIARTYMTKTALQTDPVSAFQRLARDVGVPELANLTFDADLVKTSWKASCAEGALGQWIGNVSDVIERWASNGEDREGFICFEGIRKSLDLVRPWLDSTVTSLAQEVVTQRDKVLELAKRIAALQIQTVDVDNRDLGDGQKNTPDSEFSQELARIEERWAKIFQVSRSEYEIANEQNAVFCRSISDLTDDILKLEKSLSAAQEEVQRLNLIEIACKAQVKAAQVESSTLRKSLAASKSALEKLQQEARSREASLEELQEALLVARAIEEKQAAIGKRESFFTKFPIADVSLIFSPKARKNKQRFKALRVLVSGSGLFDSKFYAARYPDVVAAGEDPLTHFIKFGGSEGRHPSLSFNSQWYLSQNPDVKAAGLNPLVHYLEYGRDEGRRRRSLVEVDGNQLANASAAPQTRISAPPPPPVELKPQPTDFSSNWVAKKQGWKSLIGLDVRKAEKVVPLEQMAERQDGRLLVIEGSVVAMLRNGEPIADAVRRASLFAALRGVSNDRVTLGGSPLEAGSPFTLLSNAGFGLELLSDAWYESQDSLLLRFANGFAGVVRAFQFANNRSLERIAEVRVSGTEADIVRVPLSSPLNEVLVVRCTPDGALIDAIVLPFPSLCRGGLHYGELAVLETAPGSMATLGEYSRTLGLEWLGWTGGPTSYKIGQIEIDLRGATGTEPIFRPSVVADLTSRFGLAIKAKNGSSLSQSEQLIALFNSSNVSPNDSRKNAQAVLTLPCDCVPSLFAITTRRLSGKPFMARVAVVDSATLVPKAEWMIPQVSQSQSVLQHPDLPAQAPLLESKGEEDAYAYDSVPLPIAVRHLNPLVWQADPLMPVPPDQPMVVRENLTADRVTMTVVIDASANDEAIAACLAALAHQIDVGCLEILLAGWQDGRRVPSTTIGVKTVPGADLPRAARLNAAAAEATGALLLFLDPAVLLSDERTIAFMTCLADQQNVATVACALVTEQEDGDDALLHSAGYFPANLSMNREPAFDVCQLDVGGVIPASTYPVVANHILCCIVDGQAWRSLGGFDVSRFPAAMFDLDFGVRASMAGYLNFCTTMVRASTKRQLQSADFPDAIAQKMVSPTSWKEIFARVTSIRDLRR